MTLQTNTKIQPLVEDIGHILPGEFLTTTEYKRWLVERNLDAAWAQCLQIIKDGRSYYMVGFNHESDDAKDALSYLLAVIFERQKEKLPEFLLDLLMFYASEKSEYIDVTNIKKDLLAVGYTQEEAATLDAIPLPRPVEEKIEESQTQEQVIRSLEKEYLSIREENSHGAIDAYLKWHSETLLYLSNFYTEANPDYATFKHLDNSGNGYSLRHNYKSIYSIYNLLMNNVTPQEIAKNVASGKKTPMVFISHSHEDEEFVIALVNLLEDMGFTKNTLFCSSVREYGIPLGGDIFETIRGLFLEHDLFVIFVHSPRFYGSAVTLNEMGAAWVLKTDFCSILTNDMDYPKMKGVVNNAKLSIKVDDKEAAALMNDLYDQLAGIFSIQQMEMNKWERKRNQFLQTVRNLKYEEVEDTVEENNVDIEYKKLQIEKMKQEAATRMKAIIRSNIVKEHKPGSRTLKIFNAGMATARNVKVEWLNDCDEVVVHGDFSIIGDLTPQNSRSYPIILISGHPETMKLRYSWDDDFAEGNTIEESIQL